MTGRELLADFIGPDRGARADFCRKANISQPHLLLFLKGERGLSVAMAKRVSEASGGVVPVKSLVADDVAELLGSAA